MENEIINLLKIIFDYLTLNMVEEKADLIIGCGCANLEVPLKCTELIKNGYSNKLLFTGGLGKLTNDKFSKTEAEIYREIAINNGINTNQIYIENKSTNTGDNFRFSLEIIKQNNLKADKILIVHSKISERRTFSSAKAIMKDKQIIITSPNITFEQFIENIITEQYSSIHDCISVIVGDIQRMIIYPQFGWQIENKVPNEVLKAYNILKQKGYDKYIFSKEQIQNLIDKYGLINEQEPNYFN